jgi:hypothetical protein
LPHSEPSFAKVAHFVPPLLNFGFLIADFGFKIPNPQSSIHNYYCPHVALSHVELSHVPVVLPPPDDDVPSPPPPPPPPPQAVKLMAVSIAINN